MGSKKKSRKKTRTAKKTGPQRYEMGLQDVHFNNVVAGLKTVEGRLNKGKFKEMKKGDTLEINGMYETKILGTVKYRTFREFLEKETLEKSLPGVNSIDAGIAVYRQFYPVEKEREFGVVAIHLALGNFKKLTNKYPEPSVPTFKPLKITKNLTSKAKKSNKAKKSSKGKKRLVSKGKKSSKGKERSSGRK